MSAPELIARTGSAAGGAAPAPPLLEARGIAKRYGHVDALTGVDFRVHAGEVVALVGDNGAGKSTLLKALCGATSRDAGEILIDGQPADIQSPADAQRAGVAVVYQDLALVDARDVATNIFLGREPGRPFVDRRRMRREAKEVLSRLNVGIGSVRTPVGELSGGQRQSVAIARAVHQGGRLIIMDEPTAALGVEGQQRVLRLVHDLRRSGVAVVVVSHNLEHVFAVSDRIVVLRGGRVVGERQAADTTSDEVVNLIVGGRVAPALRRDA